MVVWLRIAPTDSHIIWMLRHQGMALLWERLGSMDLLGKVCLLLLSVCPHFHWQVHIFCCWGIPSLTLESTSLGFQHILKTILRHTTLWTEQLLDSWTFCQVTAIAGLAGPQPVSLPQHYPHSFYRFFPQTSREPWLTQSVSRTILKFAHEA